MRNLRLILAAAAVAALGCSGDNNPSGPTTGGNGTNSVTVGTPNGGLGFNPTTISVPVNGTVTWTWNSGGVTHNVTFQDGSTSGNKSSGSYQKTFPTAGSFSYLCTIHGSIMSGTVNVTSASGQTGGTGGSGAGGGGGGGGTGSGYP
jgi:plastocyanin